MAKKSVRWTRKRVLRLIAQFEDIETRNAVLRKYLALARVGKIEFSEADLAEYIVNDVEANFETYRELLKHKGESAEALLQYFAEHPTYLARALVQIHPDIFYAEGFAHRFALRLRADLGRVLKRPRSAGGDFAPSTFVAGLPQAVRNNLISLDRERRLRELLWFFNISPELGLEALASEVSEAKDAFVRDVMVELEGYCRHLLALEFPDFVDELHGFPFPSFHVRWWVDSSRNMTRLLNMGDTGTQKTAFAVVAAHQAGGRKVLVLCPAHARGMWSREIGCYFKHAPTVHTIRRCAQAQEIALSEADYTVVGYQAITDPRVREALKQQSFDTLIWDEAHYARHAWGASASQRGLACMELISELPVQRVFALSATPWENHPGELGAIAAALRPDIFPDAGTLYRTGSFDPRFLRELFASNILEVELPEVIDLPPITPKPWEDLFGVEYVDLNPSHQAVYDFVRETDQSLLLSVAKVQRLLLATIHPHCVRDMYDWPAELRGHFDSFELSTKLVWIQQRIRQELQEGAKVVIGTGVFVKGITRPQNDRDEAWIGARLKEWFGEDHVLVLDGETSQAHDRYGRSKRERIIAQWRSDPQARILLVSIQACPDAVDLSVPKLPGIRKLFLTTFSFPWKPWKQFLGRLWRGRLGVPMSYAVPVLRNTVDESLFRLVQEKWRLQQLFRAQVPLTERELELFDRKRFTQRLVPDSRSSIETVNFASRKFRDRSEEQAQQFLGEQRGLCTNAEHFAQAFVRTHDCSASGHIVRFMQPVIEALGSSELLKSETVLDAGCGPLTLERSLGWPVYGVDMNEPLLRMGRELSRTGGVNARVGFLSRLPQEWQHRFDLTVASLVLHWASLRKRTADKLPLRVAILRELVRVTHQTGRVWLTLTSQSLTASLFERWCSTLERNEYQLIGELTGLVEAVDHRDKPFTFWSICFCPEGKPLTNIKGEDLTLTFEEDQVVIKRGKEGRRSPLPDTAAQIRHEQFVVHQEGGKRIPTLQAAQAAVAFEQQRIARLEAIPWRSWMEIKRRGIEMDLST